MTTTAFEPYCAEGCGQRATQLAFLDASSDGTPITEWLCTNHAPTIEGER